MIVFNGLVLGAGAVGLRKLCCGTDDNGTDIDAYLKTGSSLLEWSGKKKNRFIYLSVKTSGSIIITPIFDGTDGTPITFTPNSSDAKYMKMAASRGNSSYYWMYKVEIVDGC
jgi:hypothetical protein